MPPNVIVPSAIRSEGVAALSLPGLDSSNETRLAPAAGAKWLAERPGVTKRAPP